MSARFWVAAAAALFASGCEQQPDEPDYLRVVVDVDSKLLVPDDLDSFALRLERGGVMLFQENYGASVLQSLPDSLVIENPHPSNDSPEKQLLTVKPLSITLVAYKGATARVWRTARVRFNSGKWQLALPICRDCLDKECPAGTTCRNGACEDWSVTPSASDDGAQLDPLQQCGP